MLRHAKAPINWCSVAPAEYISEEALESAADLYLARYARLVSQGMEPAQAKMVCMQMAKVWLAPDRAKWIPEITDALAERIATIAIKRDLSSAIASLVDETKRRQVDAALRDEITKAMSSATDAPTKHGLKVAKVRIRTSQVREAGLVRFYAARLRELLTRHLGRPAFI